MDAVEKLLLALKELDPPLGALLTLMDSLPDGDLKRDLKVISSELLGKHFNAIEHVFKVRPDLRPLDN
jgi:hypothetical protein